jgi:NAD+ kinase
VSRPLVVVVSKRSHYERFVQEARDPKTLSLFQRRDISVSRWREAHDAHQLTLKQVKKVLRGLGAKLTVLEGPGAVFDASDANLVVTVGGDGTLLAASHHVGSVPILGVNSAPEHSVGFFCPAHSANLETELSGALNGTLPRVVLARMQVRVGDRVCSRRVLNEALFCHAIPAATSRYIVRYGDDTEEQRSSGVWVGTAAGSTAATRSAGGKVLPFASRNLQLVIREPYAESKRTVHLNHIIFDPTESLELLSKMEDARLYLDGPYRQIPVGLGDRVIFSVSDEPLHVFGLGRRRDGSRSSQFPRAVVPSPGAAAAGKRAKKPKQSS